VKKKERKKTNSLFWRLERRGKKKTEKDEKEKRGILSMVSSLCIALPFASCCAVVYQKFEIQLNS